MNPDYYIIFVIHNHIIKEQDINKAKFIANALYPKIREWAGEFYAEVKPTGSYSKGTAIKGKSDLDLLISLHSKTPYTLAEIYSSLSKYLKNAGFTIREQNVSIGINFKNISVDLIPAKKQPDSTFDHSLYCRKTNSWIKTNIHKHILIIKNSDCLREICAIKIWKKLHALEFPSFYLELSAINALKRRKKDKISSNLLTIFNYLSDEFLEEKIIDPSNSNNVISDDLNVKEKQLIAEMAKKSLIEPYWENIVWRVNG